jgi:methylmalonyl-CoA mutase N-terminal domain/subunit
MGKDTMQPTTLSDTLEPLRTAQRQWSEESLQRAPQKAVQYITASDIPLVALATPLDWPEDLYLSHLGFPGAMPYTRGVQSTLQIFAGPGERGLECGV